MPLHSKGTSDYKVGVGIQVHCVRAFGQMQEIVRHEGQFPAGAVLHSWAGSAESTRQLARIPGVFFSLSGHSLNQSERKLVPMLQEVGFCVEHCRIQSKHH